MLDRGLTDAWGRGLTWCTHTWDVGGRAIAVQPGRRSDRPGLPLPFGSPGLPIYLPIYIPSSFIYIYIYIHTHRIPAQSFSSWSDPLLSCPWTEIFSTEYRLYRFLDRLSRFSFWSSSLLSQPLYQDLLSRISAQLVSLLVHTGTYIYLYI
jgi:hypothetical protein